MQPRLEVLEHRCLLSGVTFDPITRFLDIAANAGPVVVDRAGSTDFIRITQNFVQTASSDPAAGDFDPALAGATQSTLAGITDADSSDPLTLNDLTIPGNLEVDGFQVLEFGSTTVGGTLTFQGTEFQADGTPTFGNLLIASGSLTGNGVITGPVTIPAGSSVAPGLDGELAQLTLNNGITFAPGSSLVIGMDQYDGVAPASDQLLVPGGTVALNGADLFVSVADFTPTEDMTFTIIDSASPVTGSFAQGSMVVSSGVVYSFPIAYNPDGTNGVVLGGTPPPTPAPPTQLVVTPAVPSDPPATTPSTPTYNPPTPTPVRPRHVTVLPGTPGKSSPTVAEPDTARTTANSLMIQTTVVSEQGVVETGGAAPGGSGDSSPDREFHEDVTTPVATTSVFTEPLRVYPTTQGNAETQRAVLDAVILNKPASVTASKDAPARLDPVEEASYLLNSSLSQADDNALNVERLLRRQSEPATATLPPSEEIPTTEPQEDPTRSIAPASDDANDQQSSTGNEGRRGTAGELGWRLAGLLACSLTVAVFLGTLNPRWVNRSREGSGEPFPRNR